MLMKNGQPLADLEDWKRRAGPKHPSQWKDGRSAMECARAWIEAEPPGIPVEIAATLASHPDFGAIQQWTAEPEVQLAIDDRRGEPRNTDMLVLGTDAFGDFLIAIEAKADEAFGATLADTLADAMERRLKSAASGGIDRATDLVQSLHGPRREGDAHLGTLRYQLFTAAVGALREAQRRGIGRTILLIHEFVTPLTTDDKHARNHGDLDAWLRRVSGGRFETVTPGKLIGPIAVPGQPLMPGPAQFYLGLARSTLR